MNKRQRKKYLKKKGTYVSDSEIWNLDYTIAEWIIPRLKKYKKITNGYPPIDRKVYSETKELEDITFEDWQNILDEMILAFELSLTDPFDEIEKLGFNISDDKFDKFCEERNNKIERGLDLFKYYIQDLWW